MPKSAGQEQLQSGAPTGANVIVDEANDPEFPHDAMEDSNMTDDEKAIRQLVETWMTASKAGDLATVLTLMTDDVVFSVPGQEPFGKEAFAAASQGMSGMQMEGTSQIVELQLLGDWAFIRNRIEMTATPPGGKSVRRAGYTLTLLRKEPDGKWRLARDANLLTVQP